MQMAASIALGCGGKGLFRGSRARKEAVTAHPDGGFLSSRRGQATGIGAAASRYESRQWIKISRTPDARRPTA